MCLVATLGGLILLLSSDLRNEFLAPGELSAVHAQLLGRGENTRRCASCHAAGDQTFAQWLRHVHNDQLARPTQTELCMECHKQQIDPALATAAHNVAIEKLTAGSDRDAHRRVDPAEPINCSACHREHHGTKHDLTLTSDNACQACHQQTYRSFATDHPDFEAWPTSRRTQIAFDHGSHQAKHFPKEQLEFACATCHTQGRDGTFQRTLDYETTCARCHDSKLATSWDAGIALLALPMIDADALRDAGHNIGEWPEAAQGDFDGPLPPITKLLLSSDERAALAMKTLGVDFDFFDIDPDDAEQLAAAAEVLLASKHLLHELITTGQPALRARLEKLLERQLTAQEFSDLTARLSPGNLSVINRRWLPNLAAEMGDEAAPGAPNREAAEQSTQQVAAGGWLSDETTLSLRYLPTGHADPWFTAWIDMLAEASGGPSREVARPLLKQIMEPTAAGQCGSCHSLDQGADGRLVVRWFAKQEADVPTSFTFFSHAPHLTQAELADCTACHQINSLAKVMDTYADTEPTRFESGFQPLTKQDCAKCHLPHAAGDSCQQCHRYHIDIQPASLAD